MAKRGGQPGNTNATNGKPWLDMVRRKVAQNPEQLEKAALAVLNAAADGEPWAVTELRNTLDGKPVQQVEMKDTTEAPTLSNAYLARVAAGWKPDESGREGTLQ